jgi:hypothetical protein
VTWSNPSGCNRRKTQLSIKCRNFKPSAKSKQFALPIWSGQKSDKPLKSVPKLMQESKCEKLRKAASSCTF